MFKDYQAKQESGLEELDSEWIELIMEARGLGLTVEEIKHFLASAKANALFS